MTIRNKTLLLVVVLPGLLLLTGCTGPTAIPQAAPTPALVQTTNLFSPTLPGATTLPAPAAATFVPGQATAALLPTTSGATTSATTESPLAPESNPVGDIPDTQVFTTYTSASGSYSLDVPEGWARTDNGSDVRFVDKFDGLSVTVTSASSAPTSETARQNEVEILTQAGHAFQVGSVTAANLPNGQTVRITATVNSEPDPVTDKQVRLEENIYLFYHNGSEAMLQLWAPEGADNVDQWQRISESFQWK